MNNGTQSNFPTQNDKPKNFANFKLFLLFKQFPSHYYGTWNFSKPLSSFQSKVLEVNSLAAERENIHRNPIDRGLIVKPRI